MYEAASGNIILFDTVLDVDSCNNVRFVVVALCNNTCKAFALLANPEIVGDEP